MTTEAANNLKCPPPASSATGWQSGRLSPQSALLLRDAVHHATMLALGSAEPTCTVTDEQFDAACEFFAEILGHWKVLPEEYDDGDETP